MSKENGLGWTTLTVDDTGGTARDLRTDITELSFETPRGVQEVTGIDKSAIERLLLLADFSIELSGVFDDGANLAHATLSTIPSNSSQRTVAIGVSGQTLSNECIGVSFDYERSEDGEFTWTSNFQLADGTVPTWA